MPITAAQIEQLCNNWCAASSTPGGMVIGGDTEKHRLLANGIVFHELAFEALCAALTGTSMVLLRPGLNTIVYHDHYALWAWCAEVLLSPRAQFFSRDQMELKNLFETTVHAALSGCRPPFGSPEEWEAQNKQYEIHHHHTRYFVQSSHLALAYLTFPLLEAMTKRACSSFVTFDGNVIAKYSAPRKIGGTKDYKVGDKCSSLRDLLHLHYSTVATPRLRQSIDKLRLHINQLDHTKDPFDIIYSWRNDSLHGSASFQTIGGTLLNWCFLLALPELEPDFENRRQLVLEHCRWELKSGHRSPWSFCPPY